MTRISFKFRFGFLRYVGVFIGILINLFLLFYTTLLVPIWNVKYGVGPIIAIIIYVVWTSIYSYFLLISRDVEYDDKLVSVGKNQNFDEAEIIKLESIIKIRRHLFFFYRIDYRDDHLNYNRIYFLVSLNPSLRDTPEIKELRLLISDKATSPTNSNNIINENRA